MSRPNFANFTVRAVREFTARDRVGVRHDSAPHCFLCREPHRTAHSPFEWVEIVRSDSYSELVCNLCLQRPQPNDMSAIRRVIEVMGDPCDATSA